MAKKQKTRILILLATLFILPALLLAGTSISHAQVQPQEVDTIYFTPQIEIPHSGISGKTEVSSVDDDGFVTSDLLARYIKAIYDYGIMVGGILAAIMIMAGGVIWLTSAGNSGAVEKAKSIMTGSVVGLVILFGSWFILNTINPDLVEMKGIAMIQVQNVNYISCCHPDNGEKQILVYKKDGVLYYRSGDKADLPFEGCGAELSGSSQCAEGSRCEERRQRVSAGTTSVGSPVYTTIKFYACGELSEDQVGQEFSVASCCHPSSGEIKIKYQEINGTKYRYDSSDNITENVFVSCESEGATQCSSQSTCTRSSQSYVWPEYRCFNASTAKICCHCERVMVMWNNEAIGCENGLTINECKAFCNNLGSQLGHENVNHYYRFPTDISSCEDNKCKLD